MIYLSPCNEIYLNTIKHPLMKFKFKFHFTSFKIKY